MRSLITQLLRKNPDTRPRHSRVLAQLEQYLANPIAEDMSRFEALRAAGAAAAARAAEEESAKLAQREVERRREDLWRSAMAILAEIVIQLEAVIQEAAPSVVIQESRIRGLSTWRDVIFTLGPSRLGISIRPQSVIAPLRDFHWDVVAGAEIHVQQPTPRCTYSASLWFADLEPPGGEYRWYECSYWSMSAYGPAVIGGDDHRPCALELGEAKGAHSRGLTTWQVAYGPRAIDYDDTENFLERWTSVLARAHGGRLRTPGVLPISDDRWWFTG
jgi:hypothetical protein